MSNFASFSVAAAKDASPLLDEPNEETARAIALDMIARAETISAELNAKLDPHFKAVPVCAAGCAHCCHQAVVASTPEIVLLAETLRDNLSSAALTALEAKVRAHAERTRSLSTLEWHLARHACPLLDEATGSCIAHEGRPLLCRAHNSLDVRQCVEAAEGDDPEAKITFNEYQRASMKAVWLGMLGLLRARGFDAEAYDLTQGLAIALEDESVAARFAEKQAPLAAARVARAEPHNRAYLPLYREAMVAAQALAPRAQKPASSDDEARKARNRRKKSQKK